MADRVVALTQRAIDGLAAIDRVRVWSPAAAASGVVGFTVSGADASAIHAACAERNINVAVLTSRAAPYDFLRRGEDALIRVGAHYFNLESEIDLLLEVVDAVASHGLRPT